MAGNNTIAYRVTLFLSLITLTILVVDRPAAIFIHSQLSVLQQPLQKILAGIEFVFGFTITKYFAGIILLIIGLLFYLKDRNLQRAAIFLYIATIHIVSRLTAGILKNVFERSRPYAFTDDNTTGSFFVEGGSSFPSAHAAHFLSLFLPLALLFPKYKWWLLILPVFVSLQRILVNDHFISDILASLLIVYLLIWACNRLFKINNTLLLQPTKS